MKKLRFAVIMRKEYIMNLLQIAEFNAPYSGNFISSLIMLHKNLQEQGNHIIYLFPEKARNKKWVELLIENNHIVFFYTKSVFKNYLLIKRIIRRHKINIIHIPFRNIRISYPATLAHLTTKNKLLFHHFHGEYIKGNILKEFFRKLSRFSSYYIACSKIVYNQLVKAGFNKGKVFCIENSIDFSRLDEYEQLQNKDLGIDNEVKKILMFGYDWNIKGVDLALKAIQNLIFKKEKLVLLIVIAANKEKIVQHINKMFNEIPYWVRLLTPRNDIATYYKFADLFVAPSRTEGFSYAVVEAAYCEVPIVASDILAHKNLNLTYDVYFQSENCEQLEKLITTQLNITNNEFIKKQKEIVINNYGISRWTNEMILLYKNLMQRFSKNEKS